MTSERHQIGDDYVLPTGREDKSRLDLIHAVYRRVSEAGLDAAGIGGARRAADIGCGTGTVARWMAERMGGAARVDAIDIAPEQIEVASAVPATPGAAPIRYSLGSAYDPPLDEKAFDIVFCRLVLCHLREPGRAVARMAKLLRPGGRLVLVDLDLRDVFTMPPCAAYPAFVNEAIMPLQAAIGVDYSVGLRLHDLMADAGLATQWVAADQPIIRDGPEKHLWEASWTVALKRAVPSGVITMERGRELIAAMARHTMRSDVWVAMAKMFAAVGKRAA